jgi:hypothetical protein
MAAPFRLVVASFDRRRTGGWRQQHQPPAAKGVGMDRVAQCDQWITCVHECSHVAAFTHHEPPFRWVELTETDGAITGAVQPLGGLRCDWRIRGIICLSGPLGESIITGVLPEDQPNSATDIRMAKQSLARVAVNPRPDLQSVMPFTKMMLEYEWPRVELLARELYARKRLTFPEVIHILRLAA